MKGKSCQKNMKQGGKKRCKRFWIILKLHEHDHDNA